MLKNIDARIDDISGINQGSMTLVITLLKPPLAVLIQSVKCWEIQPCIATAAAAPALIERTEPNWEM